MPAPLPIRDDLSPPELRALARKERDGRVGARLHALAHALDGRSRTEAARLAGMDRQTPSDWVRRYNAQGVEGLRDRPKPGRPCGLDAGRQAALKALVLKGPDPERDGLSAWRVRDVCDLAAARCGRRYSETGMLRLVKSLNLSWQKPRPAHLDTRRGEQERLKKPAGGRWSRWPRRTRRRSGSGSGSRMRPGSAEWALSAFPPLLRGVEAPGVRLIVRGGARRQAGGSRTAQPRARITSLTLVTAATFRMA